MDRLSLRLAIGLASLIAAWLLFRFFAPPAPAPPASGAFKVALILPGPIDDQSWSQSGYEGLQLIRTELGAEVAHRASVPPPQAEGVLREFATAGYDFIIVHGAQYIPAAEAVSDDFFRTKFAVTTAYPGNNRNFGSLAFRAGEVGYLTGVVAALKTTTKRVSYIGGEVIPITLEDIELFKRGVRSVAPDVRVSVRWVGSWADAETARRIAFEEIARRSDVLTVNAALGSRGAIEAAKARGVSVIAWNLDTYELAPRSIVTSAIQRVPVLFLEGAKLVQQGRWEGRQYKFGLREGAQALAPFRGSLTSAEVERVRAVEERIRRGEIDVAP